VSGSKRTSFLTIVLALRTQIANPNLKALRNGGLRSQTAENQLTSRIDPMCWHSGDHLAPHLSLERIEIRRRFRTPCTGGQYGNNGKRGWRSTATRHRDFPFALDAAGEAGIPSG
jgi:hypothetical protein